MGPVGGSPERAPIEAGLGGHRHFDQDDEGWTKVVLHP
jgi:hypothetical protein